MVDTVLVDFLSKTDGLVKAFKPPYTPEQPPAHGGGVSVAGFASMILAAIRAIADAPNPADCPNHQCPYYQDTASTVTIAGVLLLAVVVVVLALLILFLVRRRGRHRRLPPPPAAPPQP